MEIVRAQALPAPRDSGLCAAPEDALLAGDEAKDESANEVDEGLDEAGLGRGSESPGAGARTAGRPAGRGSASPTDPDTGRSADSRSRLIEPAHPSGRRVPASSCPGAV